MPGPTSFGFWWMNAQDRPEHWRSWQTWTNREQALLGTQSNLKPGDRALADTPSPFEASNREDRGGSLPSMVESGTDKPKPANGGRFRPAPEATRIGHVHLKVADLERAIGFYHGVLGFSITQRMGDSAAFLSAGGYHHHIGLNTWESKGGPPPAAGTTGLFHVAILYPSRAALADALRRLQKAGVRLDGASDHGVSEALYLRDPDGNGVELYWDRPREFWPRSADGELQMFSRRLDLDSLLQEQP